MKQLLAGLTFIFAIAPSAPCFADYCPGGCEESEAEKIPASPVASQNAVHALHPRAPEYPPQMFEFGLRAGPGYQYIGPIMCIDGCAGTTLNDGPNVGFDLYLRWGKSNLRWQNQLSVVFARNTEWATTQYCEGAPGCVDWQFSGGQIPLFVQATYTTGFELNTHPRGDFGFLWGLELSLGPWMSVGAPGSGGVAGFKLGLGAMLFRRWELSTQFIAGSFFSAQVLLGYNLQFGR